ncbi:MAG: Card1-like endonuclease domain-containing protein, partial [Campylobacterota bacterium]
MYFISAINSRYYSSFALLYQYRRQIDTHFLICSSDKETLQYAHSFLQTQKQMRDEGEIGYKTLLYPYDPDSFSSVQECFESIANVCSHAYDRIYLDGSGLFAPVLAQISAKILPKGGRVLGYDEYDNKVHILSHSALFIREGIESLDIKNHLRYKGYRILGHYKKYDLFSRKRTVLKLARDLSEFKQFAKHFPSFDKQRFARFNSILQDMDLDDVNATNYVRGVVFEEYIFHLIYDHLDVDDIMCGVTVEFETGHINEFDILLMKNNHLHAIECKFANNLNIENSVY